MLITLVEICKNVIPSILKKTLYHCLQHIYRRVILNTKSKEEIYRHVKYRLGKGQRIEAFSE